MPGGLPDVTQRFDADASGYIRGIQEMIAANRELVASIGDAQRKINDVRGAGGGGDNYGMFGPGGVQQIREFNRAMDEYSAAMKEASARNAELNAMQAQTERLSKQGRDALNSLREAYRGHGETVAQARQAQAIFNDGLIDQANSTRDAVVMMSEHEQAVARLAKTYGTAQEAFAKTDFSTPLEYGVAHVQRLNDALAVTERRANSFATAFYGAGGASSYGDTMRRTGAGAFGPVDPNFMSGGGGGDRGGFAAAAGGFFGAMRPSTIFGGALPTLQAAHMITMLTMETLSTVIPAAVAAGAAGVVGLQAGQNLYLRGNAMYSAQEALGGAYGDQTFGTMLGLSRNLQNAQDFAQGGVFGIAGGLRDLVGQGSGAFTGMGVQTIAMIDRGIANMVLHNRMKQVTDALSGGTGFLRSFGDIGANLGDTLLNLAPNLPGIGPGLLGGLKGITGLAAYTTGHIPGQLLGAGLAAEAGWRWGGPILGGGKLPGWLGGAKFGGLAGLAERLGLGTVADAGAGIEGAGLAGLLGSAGGPLGLGAALAAWAVSQAWTSPKARVYQKQMGALQGGIDQSFGAGALGPITHALYTVSAQQAAYAAGGAGPLGPLPAQFVAMERQGGSPAAVRAAYLASLGSYQQQFAQNLGDLVAAGPSAVKALQGIGMKGMTLTQAFEAMSMAMISPKDMKGGRLDATAKQQLQQFAQTYRTATIGGQPGNASGLLMAGAADYIMSSTEMKSLAQVNQGLDAMTQIMTGGPAGQAALFGMLGGTPVKTRRGGLQLQAPPAFGAMASALSNIYTPQGAAAWTAFAGPQGMIAAQQANMDQMRTYLTLGAISGRQGAQLGAFDLQQMLPLAAHSPMAQYMLEQQAMQANIPGISVGMSYRNLVKAITGMAPGAAGAQAILTQGVKATANIPAIAADLITGGMGGPSALSSALTAQMAQQGLALAAHPLLRGGGVNMGALQGLTSSLAAGGVRPGQMTVAVDAILKNLHVPQGLVAKINAQLNTAQVQAQLSALKDKQIHAKVNVQGTSELKHLQDEIAALKSKNVRAAAQVQGAGAVAALNAEIAALHSKEVTITTRMITIGGMAGVTPGIPAGVVNPHYHAQTGGMVPGSGSGDIIPAMLEPGEAIVPRNLVSLVAPILAAHRVPGFGGMPQSSASHFAAGGIAGGWPFSGHIGKDIGYSLVDGITKALKESGAKNIAQALVSKIGQEISYAKNVASSVRSGLNLAGMDLSQGSVLQQMQGYAAASASFGKDLATLRKQHLAKGLISQLIQAGPVQGDALAQSILGTGVGGINALWKQIGGSANIIGAQAAMAQYGGTLAPNLRSASVTQNHVSISISAPKGATLSLTPAQIKKLVEEIQAKLLQQARRNQKTGVQLSGKGA